VFWIPTPLHPVCLSPPLSRTVQRPLVANSTWPLADDPCRLLEPANPRTSWQQGIPAWMFGRHRHGRPRKSDTSPPFGHPFQEQRSPYTCIDTTTAEFNARPPLCLWSSVPSHARHSRRPRFSHGGILDVFGMRGSFGMILIEFVKGSPSRRSAKDLLA
jgi:hypothetical protein